MPNTKLAEGWPFELYSLQTTLSTHTYHVRDDELALTTHTLTPLTSPFGFGLARPPVRRGVDGLVHQLHKRVHAPLAAFGRREPRLSLIHI